MTKIDLTIEDEQATERAKQMLSGVDIEGAEKVRIVVEDADAAPVVDELVEAPSHEEKAPDADTDEVVPAGDSGN